MASLLKKLFDLMDAEYYAAAFEVSRDHNREGASISASRAAT
jgi:hypothetical protein